MNPHRSHTKALDTDAVLKTTQKSEHPHCLFCGQNNPIGFKLDFRVRKPGSVHATCSCGALFQSYPATLHGGVTAGLLDAAMTNCLFSLGVAAVTGELKVRYVNPVDVGREGELRATLDKSSPPLYYLSAELRQNNRVVTKAAAKFVDRRWGTDEWGAEKGTRGDAV